MIPVDLKIYSNSRLVARVNCKIMTMTAKNATLYILTSPSSSKYLKSNHLEARLTEKAIIFDSLNTGYLSFLISQAITRPKTHIKPF